jgi:hypothetical protein
MCLGETVTDVLTTYHVNRILKGCQNGMQETEMRPP